MNAMVDVKEKFKIEPGLLRAGLVFIFVLLVSVASIVASYVYMDGVSDERLKANRAMRVWQSRINDSVQNNQIIEQFETNFIKLVEQGVVGEEERLNWFETVQATAKRRGMPLVKYSISSRTLLKDKDIKRAYPGIDVFKSTMTLSINMGHEGDLFVLLNDLEKAKGLFAIDKCDIKKIMQKEEGSVNNMQAYCELGWYTFRGTQKGKS